ncbi:uncharacterized protein LOC127001468 isoform X2 [Eriocheir sinensis]|uniref:uncharacterized protein LOC127001468 isoform X2 n=1 Tax=Eriocheir sinensis TaxID=95602 RepID=UPI0021CA38D4|nr:uncharacterized protein LOC127001468 isoform X2 [Eriocheir sinensis]
MNSVVVMVVVVVVGLLANEGVQGRRCFSCNDCASVDLQENTEYCAASCLAIVTCNGKGETPSVDRFCSITNHDNECVATSSSSSSSTYECYCNNDHCDALLADPDLCDAAASTAASLALVVAAAALLSGLSLAG